MFFKWRVVATWAFFSVYQSLVFFYFVTSSSHTSVDPSGKMFGLMDIGTMTFTCVVVTVNLRLLMNCNSITRWHYISTGGSIALWFIFVFIYCFVESSVGLRSLSNNHSLPLLISNLPSNFKMLTFFFNAEECLSGHICLDEYIVLLHDTSSCPHCCALWRLCLPRVRK